MYFWHEGSRVVMHRPVNAPHHSPPTPPPLSAGGTTPAHRLPDQALQGLIGRAFLVQGQAWTGVGSISARQGGASSRSAAPAAQHNVLGKKWSRLEKSGRAWKKLVVLAWKKVVALGKKWSRLEKSGRAWKIMVVFLAGPSGPDPPGRQKTSDKQ